MNYFNRMNYVSESYGGMTQDNGVIFEGMADDFTIMVMEDDMSIRESLYLATEVELEGYKVVNAMEADGCTESAIMETVEDVNIVMENVFKKFWETIKAAVKKMKDAIIKFFGAARRYLDAIFMSSQQFIKKYDSQIKKLENLSDHEYKSYNYVNFKTFASDRSKLASTTADTTIKSFVNVGNQNHMSKDDLKEAKTKLETLVSTCKKEINNKIFGKNLETVDNQSEVLFKLLRGDMPKGTQKTVKFNVNTVISKMKNSDDVASAIKTSQSECKESLDELIRLIEVWEKDEDKFQQDERKAVSKKTAEEYGTKASDYATPSDLSSFLKARATKCKEIVSYQSSITTKVFNATLSAHKEEQSVLKWACNKAFAHSKNKSKKK